MMDLLQGIALKWLILNNRLGSPRGISPGASRNFPTQGLHGKPANRPESARQPQEGNKAQSADGARTAHTFPRAAAHRIRVCPAEGEVISSTRHGHAEDVKPDALGDRVPKPSRLFCWNCGKIVLSTPNAAQDCVT